jgi:hypothetical protein
VPDTVFAFPGLGAAVFETLLVSAIGAKPTFADV